MSDIKKLTREEQLTTMIEIIEQEIREYQHDLDTYKEELKEIKGKKKIKVIKYEQKSASTNNNR